MATIDLIILGMLKKESLSAYDIQKLVEYRTVSKWVKISTPSIYKKVLQLEEKGLIFSHTEKEGKMPQKAVYTLTDAGKEEFERLMFEISCKPINIFLDFNAVIVNLESMSKENQKECLDNIENNMHVLKTYLEENIALKEDAPDIPAMGRAVLHQQFLLVQAMEEWIAKLPVSGRDAGVNAKRLMPPLWIAFPELERYSIGWRMGYGESYRNEWGKWFDSLTEDDVKEYKELFPEPVTWKGYWEDEDFLCDCYQRNEFVIKFWREKGKPKYSVEQIRKLFSEGKELEYLMFWKPQSSSDAGITKSCLSQWQKTDFWSVLDEYCCMEQFMMANKALLFGDEEIYKQIMQCSDPKQMKALGRKVKNFDEAVWDEVKYSIVLNGNYLKFSQNPRLRDFLLSTGDCILVEASPYDAIWGIKMGQTDENVFNPLKWRGQNLLGFALMEVRDEIRRVWKNAEDK